MDYLGISLEDRCPTGVLGFDEIVEGGFPRQRTVLLSGTCGSGKTTFAVQFLVNGITKFNEPGVLISLEEDPRELRKDMLRFGMDIERLEYEGNLVIVDASLAHIGLGMYGDLSSPLSSANVDRTQGSMSLTAEEFNLDRILDITLQKAKKIGAKRAVFDSLPALDFLIDEAEESRIKQKVRKLLLSLTYKLKEAGLTTVIITEQEDDGRSIHGVESYITDGVVNMHYSSVGSASVRGLTIKKMRGTEHSEDIHPINIRKGYGVEVLSPEQTL